MQSLKFKPLFDKAFIFTAWVPALLIITAATVAAAFEPTALFVMIPTDLFTLYFLFSSMAGYVELREKAVFVKVGFIITREIPYSKIRSLTKERKFYSDSTISLKSSLEHVNIHYNRFDVLSVSVKDNDTLIAELEARISK